MNNIGVEIKLIKDFNIVVETLTRIGIVCRKKKIITPSCYILYKRGKYYIVHFKEMLRMDGYKDHIDEYDLLRRTSITNLLHQWKIIKIVNKDFIFDKLPIKILTLKKEEMINYTINHKYQMLSMMRKKNKIKNYFNKPKHFISS